MGQKGFGFIEVIVVVVVVVVVGGTIYCAVTGNCGGGQSGEEGISFEDQCDDVYQDCIAMCLPNDFNCDLDCQHEYELCRNSGTAQALEAFQEKVDKEEKRKNCYFNWLYFRDKCQEKVREISTNEDGTFNRDILMNSDLREQFYLVAEEAMACRDDCDNRFCDCLQEVPIEVSQMPKYCD